MEQLNTKLLQKNILFQSLDSGIFMSGMVFFHQMTIMVVLIQQLWDSPIIVSLIPALLFIGNYLPGLLTTRVAERFPFRKRFITIGGFIQRLFVLGMALSVFLLQPIGPRLTALVVLLCYFGFAVMGGVYNPAWIDFCAKTIPVNYRARTNSFRSVIAGFGGILAPLLINFLLKHFTFPYNYQISIFFGFILLFCSFIFFLMIKEGEPSPPVHIKKLGDYFSSLQVVLQKDKNFVRFLITQVVQSVSECGASFYMYYAINRFSVGESTVVLYTLLYNVSFLGFGFLLGFIGDKFGNLQVLRLGAIGTFLALLLIILFPFPFTLYIVFVLVGINFNARLNSIQVFITEFGDEENRIRYSTLATTIGTASFGLTPLIGGILLSVFNISYTVLFVIGAAFAFAAFLLYTFLVKEPNDRSL